MGRIMTVNTNLIKPTQSSLNEGRFRKALIEFKKRGVEGLTPSPCREYADAGFFRVIGDHSRITIATIVKQDVPIYVPDSKDDLMREGDFPNVNAQSIKDMNSNIMDRYHRLGAAFYILKHDYQIETFNGLIRHNDKLIRRVWNSVLGARVPMVS